ncbi:MAG TPA: CBS domain-containing protein [Balneolaceae bacterium]|nr:CBS domain-containing protein [Balneolaceae bacterium]
MHIKNLINTDFIPLVPSDTVSAAISKIEAWQAYNIPVIEPATKKVVGTIHYGDLPEDLNEETVLTDIRWQPAVTRFETEHLFEAARFMIQHQKKLLTVTDENESFTGVIERKRIFEALSDMLNITSSGSVITVMMRQVDFTLAKIIHLIESEGAKILGLTTEFLNDQGAFVNISIKLNLTDTSAVISSLNRYGYVANSETRDDFLHEDLSNRASELLRYLEL